MILTRREWLAVPGLMAGAGRLAAQSTVHDEIRALAKNAPLRMQFKGGGAEEDEADQVSCLDAVTGAEIWNAAVPCLIRALPR